MAERILDVLGFPPELGFGWPELGMFAAAIASSIHVYLSADTHGFVTPGYRVPFDQLPAKAKAKVYASIACWLIFLGIVLSTISTA